jgi:protein TonB
VSILASYSASNVKPVYPRMSQRLGEQGTVVLRVLVRGDGTAGAVEVKSSSGFTRLDQSAVDAVKTWRFNPATIDGKPVDEWYQVPIPFKLQN